MDNAQRFSPSILAVACARSNSSNLPAKRLFGSQQIQLAEQPAGDAAGAGVGVGLAPVALALEIGRGGFWTRTSQNELCPPCCCCTHTENLQSTAHVGMVFRSRQAGPGSSPRPPIPPIPRGTGGSGVPAGDFSRPHTLIGSALCIPAVVSFAAPSLEAALSPLAVGAWDTARPMHVGGGVAPLWPRRH